MCQRDGYLPRCIYARLFRPQRPVAGCNRPSCGSHVGVTSQSRPLRRGNSTLLCLAVSNRLACSSMTAAQSCSTASEDVCCTENIRNMLVELWHSLKQLKCQKATIFLYARSHGQGYMYSYKSLLHVRMLNSTHIQYLTGRGGRGRINNDKQRIRKLEPSGHGQSL